MSPSVTDSAKAGATTVLISLSEGEQGIQLRDKMEKRRGIDRERKE